MKIYSIFASIDGEVNHFYQGRLSVFVRFSNCNLHCKYCDTKYSWGDVGKEMSIKEVMDEVRKYNCSKVTITGGEPFLQMDSMFDLIMELLKKDYDISVETNGSIQLPSYERVLPVSWIVDYKLPSSGEMEKMNFNWQLLREKDFVKFVIQDWDDFLEADKVRIKMIESGCQAKFAYSPIHGVLSAERLIQWLYEVGPRDAILNLQLHKYLGLMEDE